MYTTAVLNITFFSVVTGPFESNLCLMIRGGHFTNLMFLDSGSRTTLLFDYMENVKLPHIRHDALIKPKLRNDLL